MTTLTPRRAEIGPTLTAAPVRQDRVNPQQDSTQLIAAVPALLGYFPEESLIVLPYRHSQHFMFAVAIREDLANLADGSVPLDNLVESVVMYGCAGVVVLVVSNELEADSDLPPHPDLVRQLRDACQAKGITFSYAVHANEIRKGSRWSRYCFEGEAEVVGVQADPRGTEIARSRSANGLETYDTHVDFRDSLRPVDVVTLTRRRAALDLQARDQVRKPLVSDEFTPALITVFSAAEAAELGDLPQRDEEIVDLVKALWVPGIATACLGLASRSNMTVGFLRLWQHLSRELPKEYRADAVVLLAFSAASLRLNELASLAARWLAECDPGQLPGEVILGDMRYGILSPDRVLLTCDKSIELTQMIFTKPRLS